MDDFGHAENPIHDRNEQSTKKKREDDDDDDTALGSRRMALGVSVLDIGSTRDFIAYL